jgi:CRP/FNR family cyclic AMP-dependent transcriptional regulator
MNRFRKLGFIEYNGRIKVHKSLLNIILHDQLSDYSAASPAIAPTTRSKSGGGNRSGAR